MPGLACFSIQCGTKSQENQQEKQFFVDLLDNVINAAIYRNSGKTATTSYDTSSSSKPSGGSLRSNSGNLSVSCILYPSGLFQRKTAEFGGPKFKILYGNFREVFEPLFFIPWLIPAGPNFI